MNWQEILTIIIPLAGFLGWVYSRIDKRFDEMKKESRYNSEKIDERFEKMEKQINERFTVIEKDLNSLTTRVAVIESKLSDINTNVAYLMWHQQSLPQQDVKEE